MDMNLTPAEVVARWNGAVTKGTLANWRSKGVGPSYLKFGGRVRYKLSAIEAYEKANSVTNDNTEPVSKEAAA